MKGFGKRVPGCGYCIHANKEKMKCFPESEDCKSEYDLEEEDFNKECDCDFFELNDTGVKADASVCTVVVDSNHSGDIIADISANIDTTISSINISECNVYDSCKSKNFDNTNTMVDKIRNDIDKLLDEISSYFEVEKDSILICYDYDNLPVPSYRHSMLMCIKECDDKCYLYKLKLVNYLNDVKVYEWKKIPYEELPPIFKE